MNQTDDSYNRLIPCAACSTLIATLAVSCPKCGAPNDWKHPDVQAFVAHAGQSAITKRAYNFTHTKFEIAGETAARPPVWSFLISAFFLFCMAVGAVLGESAFWLGTFAFLAIFLPWQLRKRDWFKADLKNRTWTSSNEKLWRPVRSRLKV